MGSKLKANLRREASTKQLAPVKKPYAVYKSIQGKKLASTSAGVTLKKMDPKSKILPVKRINTVGNVIAKKTVLTRNGPVVKKFAAVKKPSVATKMAITMNKSEPIKKDAPAVKVEPPKKINEIKRVVTVDNAIVEENQFLSAIKKETTNPPAKEIPKGEDKETPPIDCKKPSPAKVFAMETEHENKVWQEFCDASINKEDQSITDKSGNEAGDDSKNIQGLNINQEQLNIKNSLYVKMLFTDRPPKGTLMEFINKYKLQSFKRIDNSVNLFAAKLNNMDEFELICNAKEVYCGQVKVTVKPCYKHSPNQPESITTTGSEDHGSKSKENHEEEKIIVENVKNEDTTYKEISEGKSAIKSINQTEQSKKSPENPKDMKNLKDANACKTSPMKPDNSPKVIKSITNFDDEANASNVNIKIDNCSVKEKLGLDNNSGSVNTNNLLIKSINITTKQTTNKLVSKDITESKVTKNTTEFKVIKDNNRQQIKVVTNVQKDTSLDYNEELREISENAFEDDEEMDDQDILALISEGIVLDECCDSD